MRGDSDRDTGMRRECAATLRVHHLDGMWDLRRLWAVDDHRVFHAALLSACERVRVWS